MKRWTIRILICLLLGAILNVAVAWGLAALVRHPQGMSDERYFLGFEPNDLPTWYITGWSGFGSLQVCSVSYETVAWIGFVDKPSVRDLVPRWSRIYSTTADPSETVIEDARGWPMLSMRSDLYGSLHSSRVTKAVAAVLLNPAPVGSGAFQWLAPRAIPLRPIFPGFIINTLFYALICFALWFAPGMIRRRIRSARGRCIKCGYDLRASPDGECPECGWGREDEP